jgi:hypothetical protein
MDKQAPNEALVNHTFNVTRLVNNWQLDVFLMVEVLFLISGE